jgi:uncharacterized protein (DUF1810 family)
MTDTDSLERFVAAQDTGGTYERALGELCRGRKESHWMWFVFPQIEGLGRSPTARRFSIADLDEARAYLSHPVLGGRLLDCCRALLDGPGADAEAILGPIDAVKLRSSITLFALTDPDEPLFGAVLDRFYDGRMDATTERISFAR